MKTRTSILIIACLIFHAALFPPASSAADETKTVRIDGKTVYIPETKLTQKENPVESFLHIASWSGDTKSRKIDSPLCWIDTKNNSIGIDSPETFLENSTTKVVTQAGMEAFLNGITWGKRQVTHIAFKITSDKRQTAIIEIYTNSGAVMFQNGKFASAVTADDVRASGGRGHLPITLERGDNIINIKQFTVRGKPQFKLSVNLDYSQSLEAVWQAKNGLLKKLVYSPGNPDDPVALDWDPNLSGFAISLEVRDVSTDKIVLQKERARRGKVTGDEDADFAPGVYEALYRTRATNESASELFLVGNPEELFAKYQEALAQYNPDSESKLDITAQLRRARILLAEKHLNALDRPWQEKIAYTLSCLATFERRLKEGATNIAKDQTGLHIRGFLSGEDGSNQFYRLYIPSTYKPGAPLPMLVIPTARMTKSRHPFIGGPIIANHREALLWAKYAEQHGFAVLWPGFRGRPDGYSYESVHINEAIQAVEKDYAIDPHRISVYGTCSAGYNAGRLVEEYNNRFAAIVYDLAVFDLSLRNVSSSPSLMEWYTTVNPSSQVIDNRKLKIFVLHDNSRTPGHGPLERTTDFLDQAAKVRGDVVSHLSEYPMPNAARMDTVFSWLAPCKNENPNDKRSNFLAKAGYAGPIMEIFSTPVLVVEGTHAQGVDLENIHKVVESLQKSYTKYFHGSIDPDSNMKLTDKPVKVKNGTSGKSGRFAKKRQAKQSAQPAAATSSAIASSAAASNADTPSDTPSGAAASSASGNKSPFRGARCVVKKDDELTQDDIATHSLILVGNPTSNSAWGKLQPQLPVKMTATSVMYGDDRLTGFLPFQAIVRHPTANDKYVLMIGAGDLRTLDQVTTDGLFTAWYDCLLFSPDKIIGKLDDLHNERNRVNTNAQKQPDSRQKAQNAQKNTSKAKPEKK